MLLTFLKYMLYNRVCHFNLGHSQKFDDTPVSCFFPEFASSNQKALKQRFCHICITVFKFCDVSMLRDRAQVEHPGNREACGDRGGCD